MVKGENLVDQAGSQRHIVGWVENLNTMPVNMLVKPPASWVHYNHHQSPLPHEGSRSTIKLVGISEFKVSY